MGISTCCLPPLHNIIIFLLCVQFFTHSVVSDGDVLSGLIVWASSPYVLSGAEYGRFCGFLVFYDLIGARIILHIWALICLHTVLYNPISLLYHSIISLPDLLCSFYNTSLVHSSDDIHAPIKNTQFQNIPRPM